MESTENIQKYIKLKYPFLFNVLMYHRTHLNKRIQLQGFYYQEQIYKDTADYMVVKKATQNGISEYMICRSIYEASCGRNVLYVLPNDLLRSRFVMGRMDKTIENTKEYQRLSKQIDSVNMKQFGTGIINIVGSNSAANFTEFVAHTVIIDEMDRCDQANIEMANERQSSIVDKRIMKVSNPTLLEFGIDTEFNRSDMKHWYINCDCGHEFTPDFFKHVVRKVENDYILRDEKWTGPDDGDINLICDKCGRPVDRFAPGRWINHEKSEISGYYISKLFSTKVTMQELVTKFNQGLTNDIVLQRFYNGDLGLAFTADGAKITTENLNDCIADYSMLSDSKRPCLMGIDVGNVLTVIIGEMLPDNRIRIINICEVREREDIVDLLKRYHVIIGVIDSRPETRLSRSLATSYRSMWMNDYLTEAMKDTIDLKKKIIKVDRTTSMDGVKEAILTKVIELPKNAPTIPKFYDQMTASVRVFQEGEGVKQGRYVWTENGQADHYHHAMNYMLIARKLMMMAK